MRSFLAKLAAPALLATLIVFAFCLGAQAAPAQPEYEVLDQDLSGVVIGVRVPELQWSQTELLGREFTSLDLPGAGVLGELGAPRLPVLRCFVNIPFGGEPRLEVLDASGRSLTAAQTGIVLPIEPQQAPVPKLPGALERRSLALDNAVYALNGLLIDDLATIADVGVWHGLRVALVEIYPVDLNPSTNELDLLNSLTIAISVDQIDRQATAAALGRFVTPHDVQGGRMLLVNPPDAPKGDKELTEALLVIAPPALAYDATLAEFIKWKRLMGYEVTLLTTDVTGSDANSVRSAIANFYASNPVPLEFVLLVGDTNLIGYANGSGSDSPATDLYFAAVDGTDYYPDLGVGRLPVRDAGQLYNALTKLMSHERGLWSVPDTWETHAVFMSSTDNYNITEGTHNYVISTYLAPRGWTSDKLYSYTYHATAAQVTASFNAGASFGIYSGHGSETTWADGPAYNQSQVRALTNQVYPYVQSYACLTGSYEIDECFAETWVRASAGAATFMGSSVSSFWDEDDIMERATFNSYFGNYKGEALTWTYGMMDYAKMAVLAAYGPTSDVRRYFEMYNIMGDASLDVRSEIPVQLTLSVTNPLPGPLGALDVIVPELPQVRVTVYCEGVVQATALTDGSGKVSFSFDPTLPAGITLSIAATKFNARAAVLEVPVIDAGVQVDSFTATGLDWAVGLDWSASVESGVQSYALYRSESEDGEYAQIASGIAPGGSPYYYEDQGLIGGTTYFYKLEAVTASGSVWYGPVSAVTGGEGNPPGDDDDDDDDSSICG